jgi:Nif-specific regulatory protein
MSREEEQRLHYQSGEGIVGRVFANGIQLMLPDVRNEPLFLNRSRIPPTGGNTHGPAKPIPWCSRWVHIGSNSTGFLHDVRFLHGIAPNR